MKVKLLLAVSFLVVSCASYVEGSKKEISIFSQPSSATVYIDGKTCLTPCDVEVSRKVEKLYLYKKGFPPKEVKLEKKVSSWFWANLLFFPLGMIVDYKTGAMWDLPEEINIVLEKK
ncbi:MAG: PEGA domain-containing protein [Aquificae bacterium]|nr:PEGA domain-containing protein [Aquificota bacterium]